MVVAKRIAAHHLGAIPGGIWAPGLLVASIVARELWDHSGAAATFYAGAVFAGLAVVGLLMQIRMRRNDSSG
jgi:hypothetical protein